VLQEQKSANAAYLKSWNSQAEDLPYISNPVSLAKITKEWGIKGQMKALPLSNCIYSLPPETEITLHLPSGHSECRNLSSVRKAGKYAILSINGISSPEHASEYRGADIRADSLLPDLPETEYFHDQIIGLMVSTPEGGIIGKVTGIFETGSNDVYVVEGSEKEYLIPAIRDVIIEIDLTRGTIIIQPLEGLLD